MGAEVGAQVEVEREPLVAERALEWLFAGVHELVPFEFGVVEEPFVAAVNRTYVLPLAMGHEVLSERRRVLEQFGAPEHVASEDASLLAS